MRSVAPETRALRRGRTERRRGRGADVARAEAPTPKEPVRSVAAGVGLAAVIGLGAATAALAVVDFKENLEPFVLYGSVRKQYLIEVLGEGDLANKIVRREKGLTVKSCVAIVPASFESPEFQRLSTRQKREAYGRDRCSTRTVSGEIKSEKDTRPACVPACKNSCNDAVRAFSEESYRRTGLSGVGEEEDLVKVVKSCVKRCAAECTKPGKTFDFEVGVRR
mmetsp:Transcript_12139/g.39914  ORF Transcript_12139/g.39914 Transcript_12139/m.39914 type:complete len:222 (+) Transcript_12139:3-668(+)